MYPQSPCSISSEVMQMWRSGKWSKFTYDNRSANNKFKFKEPTFKTYWPICMRFVCCLHGGTSRIVLKFAGLQRGENCYCYLSLSTYQILSQG